MKILRMPCLLGCLLGALSTAGAEAAGIVAQPLVLPGTGNASMDYLAFDAKTHALWIPAGNRGATFVLDTRVNHFETVPGFPTQAVGEHVLGPSAAAIGDANVFIGNRAGAEVCAFDRLSRAKRGCVTLPSAPDGLQYVASRKELWVTTPEDKSLQVLDVAGPQPKRLASIPLPGEPEGYSVDEANGVFFTNLEDADRTLAIDLVSRKVLSTWNPACKGRGPRGLSFEPQGRLLFVACSDGAVTLDAGHGGRVLGRVRTAPGVDNPAWDGLGRTLFLASAKDGKLTVVKVSAAGEMTIASRVPTHEGCRSVYLDDRGHAYLPDSKAGRLLVVPVRP